MSFKSTWIALCLAAVTLASAPPAPRKKRAAGEKTSGHLTAWLWREPAGFLDLAAGPGGRGGEPRPPFTFLKEDLKGYSPKIQVRDADGTKWTAKLGSEARPETAATRLVWAVGYYVTWDYYLDRAPVSGLPPHLKRGSDFVETGGILRGVRFKRPPKGFHKTGIWAWSLNPFSGAREMNGLRVLMAVINNWDLKDDNNAVYEGDTPEGVQQVYMVGDLGASFGATGDVLRNNKGVADVYRRSRFIRRESSRYVDFVTPTHPNLLRFYDLPYVLQWFHMRAIERGIPRDDARWIGRRLGRLSPEQLRDPFRAAGYSPEEVEVFASTLERRIAVLSEL